MKRVEATRLSVLGRRRAGCAAHELRTTLTAKTAQLDEVSKVKKSLLFLHVQELKNIARRLLLSDKGIKTELIERVVHFIETGERLAPKKFPLLSCARRGQIYELALQEPMLKGAYKNDLKTRLFFKKHIGSHFHFTAFGIDWLNEQWMNGSPPTYQEFAAMWELEYARRKEVPAVPKAEWAYINFVQGFVKLNPHARREDILIAWERERAWHKELVYKTIESLLV